MLLLENLYYYLGLFRDNSSNVELLLPATRHAQHNSIHKLFLDPQGKHLIISCSNGDNYYVNHSWRKPKLLTRIKVSLTSLIDVVMQD